MGLGTLNEECPELMGAFVKMDQAAYVEGELERKYKELIGLAIALYARCEYCMAHPMSNRLSRKALTVKKSLRPCSVAVAFGGSLSMRIPVDIGYEGVGRV